MGDESEEVAGISVTCGWKQAAEKVKDFSGAKSVVSMNWCGKIEKRKVETKIIEMKISKSKT